jgi:hypothetical protein
VFFTIDDSYKTAENYINTIDDWLKEGFANLTDNEKEEIDDVIEAFTGSIIDKSVKSALEGLKSGNFFEENFSILAAARTSIQGAMYDYLIDEFDKVFKIERLNITEESFENEENNIKKTIRHFLTEVAVNGFGSLTNEIIEPFYQVLDKLSSEKKLIKLFALIDGFVNEINSMENIDLDDIPSKRWSDMWSRAMILTQKLPSESEIKSISGEYYILGIDIMQHPRFVSLKFYGVLKNDKEIKFSPFTISSPKVDSIVGTDIWLLFNNINNLKEALSKGYSLKIDNMQILNNGVLVWDDKKATLLEEFDIFEKAELLNECKRSKILALERHPVHINELIVFDNCEFKDEFVIYKDFKIKIDKRRFYSCSPLQYKDLKGAEKIIGLLRYDTEWLLQPITIYKKTGKKKTIIHNGLYSIDVPKKGKRNTNSNNVLILRERATRLLRK